MAEDIQRPSEDEAAKDGKYEVAAWDDLYKDMFQFENNTSFSSATTAHTKRTQLNSRNTLQTRGLMCSKNQGHKNFIPVREFDISHLQALSKEYNDEDIVDLILALADLTVHISALHVSTARPKRFPYYKNRGTDVIRTGSGWVWRVYPEEELVDGPRKSSDGSNHSPEPCPVNAYKKRNRSAKQSVTDFLPPESQPMVTKLAWANPPPEPRKSPVKSWIVEIATAAHVVCDDIEVKDSEVRLFFDDPNSVGAKIEGIKSDPVRTDIIEDKCIFYCRLQDEDVANQLIRARADMKDASERMKKKYYDASRFVALTQESPSRQGKVGEPVFVISHPHGCSKFISIGRVVTTDESKQTLTHSACTCPGSSGGWVGRVWMGGFVYPHSKGLSNGTNRSGKCAYWSS